MARSSSTASTTRCVSAPARPTTRRYDRSPQLPIRSSTMRFTFLRRAGLLALAGLTATPALAEEAKLDTGDTAWMLAATALVLMMTIPGIALFYGGMVRKKNVLATVMQSFAVACLVTVLWTIIGYSLAFTEGKPYWGNVLGGYIGGLTQFMLNSLGLATVNPLAPTIPE